MHTGATLAAYCQTGDSGQNPACSMGHAHAAGYVAAMKEPSYSFKDAGPSVIVIACNSSKSKDVQVQVTGDALTVFAHRDAERVVLLSVPQLYSTIDASALDWEDRDGQITIKLNKLDPSLQWPQLEAPERQAESNAEDNPVDDREKVKAVLSAAQSGDIEAFKAAGRHFPAGLDAIKDANGRNALHFAAAASNADMCNFLAREEGFSLDATDESGMRAPLTVPIAHLEHLTWRAAADDLR